MAEAVSMSPLSSEPSELNEPAATTEEFHAALRQGGYRMTPQRRLVLQAVAALGHGTPDAIAEEVQRTASGVNLSTVYRTLDLLEGLGLVTHTHLGHGSPTYHVAQDSDHLHLVCQDCGGVEHVAELLARPFAEALKSDTGFRADLRHFAVYGRCASCQAGEATLPPGLPPGATFEVAP
jgi:Fur family transcriptional regulator, ferric uptake regulator